MTQTLSRFELRVLTAVKTWADAPGKESELQVEKKAENKGLKIFS
jgi:hypothetical protein